MRKKTVIFMKNANNWGFVPWKQVRAEACFFLIPAGVIGRSLLHFLLFLPLLGLGLDRHLHVFSQPAS